jgi:SAM-dependent methyltransferase
VPFTSTPLQFNNSSSRFARQGDKAMFDAIVADMLAHGGALAPSDHWNQNLGKTPSQSRISSYTESLYKEKYSNLALMLDPWVGVTGMQPLQAHSVTKYEPFLRALDHDRQLPGDLLAYGQKYGWRETDLGSLMDVALITAFNRITPASGERLRVFEVGGGYGRLAEAMLSMVPGKMHYVLVDAVPGSLMYAFLYMRQQFPDLKIGSFYNGDTYSQEFDCYIMPAWQTPSLPDRSFDIAINVESLQEMEQQHVDYYLPLFARLTVIGGLIYLSNARDYVFRGTWHLPAGWQPLLMCNTPRSWTADHPTMAFRNEEGDYRHEQRAHEAAFAAQINAWRNEQELMARMAVKEVPPQEQPRPMSFPLRLLKRAVR